MDKFNYDQSLLDRTSERPRFSKRYVLELPDGNSGNYQSSQITFNLPSISTQDAFMSFQESYITFPYDVTVTSTVDLAAEKSLMACLKSGFHNLIASISCNIDNNQILNIQDLDNIPLTFKILSKSSQDDLANLADSINFAQDNVQSISLHATAGDVNGKVNDVNRLKSDVETSNPTNDAFLTRAYKTAYNPLVGSRADFTDLAKTAEKRKSHMENVSNKVIKYHILVTLPLRFMAVDLFEKMPLCKGVFMKLNINVHSGTSTFDVTHGSGAILNVTTSTKFGCFPVMLAERTETWDTTADTSITVTCGVTPNSLQTSALYNAVMYRMTEPYERAYLSNVPSKDIDYTALATNKLTNVTANSVFNLLVSNSISKMRWLLIQTQMNHAISPITSPFTSAPATCMKEGSLSAFQVKIGGVPLYNDAKAYTYDMFMNEIRGANALYGGLELGLSSGLLNEKNWSEGYGYYFVDLSRKRDDADDVVPKAIEVIGRNNTTKPMDLHFFVGYEQSFNINTATGKVTI